MKHCDRQTVLLLLAVLYVLYTRQQLMMYVLQRFLYAEQQVAMSLMMDGGYEVVTQTLMHDHEDEHLTH